MKKYYIYGYTVSCNGNGEDAQITELTKDELVLALEWIKKNIIPATKPYTDESSYGIKHRMQYDPSMHYFYVTNNQFKQLMLLSGYMPVNPEDLNWVFCISPKSPAFAKREDGGYLND